MSPQAMSRAMSARDRWLFPMMLLPLVGVPFVDVTRDVISVTYSTHQPQSMS